MALIRVQGRQGFQWKLHTERVFKCTCVCVRKRTCVCVWLYLSTTTQRKGWLKRDACSFTQYHFECLFLSVYVCTCVRVHLCVSMPTSREIRWLRCRRGLNLKNKTLCQHLRTCLQQNEKKECFHISLWGWWCDEICHSLAGGQLGKNTACCYWFKPTGLKGVQSDLWTYGSV